MKISKRLMEGALKCLVSMLILLSVVSLSNAIDINYCVSGANTTSANGLYTNQTGLYEGCIWYLQDGGNNNLRLEGNNWTIIDGGYGLWEYYHPIDVNQDEGGECLINESWIWLVMENGTEPVPNVNAGLCSTTTTTTIITTTTHTTLSGGSPSSSTNGLNMIVEIIGQFGGDVVPSLVTVIINSMPIKIIGIIVLFLGGMIASSNKTKST